MAVLRRDVGDDATPLVWGGPPSGIWPNRDATSSNAIARDRGYDEIFNLIGEARLASGADSVPDQPDRG